MTNTFITKEIDKSIALLQSIRHDLPLLTAAEHAGQLCADAIRGGAKIMFCGNGGSAADSQHLAAELVGKLIAPRPAMAALALTVDSSALTAIGNDFGYEFVFARQVEGLARPGDVLVGISTSGQSVNVVRAMETARKQGCKTIAMTGATAGPMSALADVWIAVPHNETPKIQEGHILLGHIFCSIVETSVFSR